VLRLFLSTFNGKGLVALFARLPQLEKDTARATAIAGTVLPQRLTMTLPIAPIYADKREGFTSRLGSVPIHATRLEES
jgi:hypothetical protein